MRKKNEVLQMALKGSLKVTKALRNFERLTAKEKTTLWVFKAIDWTNREGFMFPCIQDYPHLSEQEGSVYRCSDGPVYLHAGHGEQVGDLLE